MKYTIKHYVATSTSVKKITSMVVRATNKKVSFLPTRIIKPLTNGEIYGYNVYQA